MRRSLGLPAPGSTTRPTRGGGNHESTFACEFANGVDGRHRILAHQRLDEGRAERMQRRNATAQTRQRRTTYPPMPEGLQFGLAQQEQPPAAERATAGFIGRVVLPGEGTPLHASMFVALAC
jgi:hypothetical protein